MSLQARALVEVSSGSEKSAATALARLPKSEDGQFWWVSAHARALYERQWGDPRRGIARLEQLLRYHRSSCEVALFPAQLLRSDLASLHQAVGDLAGARRVLQTPGLHPDQAPVRIAWVRQHLLEGRQLDALGLLRGEQLRAVTSGTTSLLVLRATAEHVHSGTVPRRVMADAAARLRMSGALFAAQEAFGPVRERLLSEAGLGAQAYRVEYPYGSVQLTRRERQILRALHVHSSSQDIARHLSVSVNTVKTHKRTLYRKLGVHNREQALLFTGTDSASQGETG